MSVNEKPADEGSAKLSKIAKLGTAGFADLFLLGIYTVMYLCVVSSFIFDR